MSCCWVRIIRASCFLVALTPCFSAYGFVMYGHRGARGLAPENTLPGYHVALMQGVDYVDLDVTMTKDGILVVQHDLTLNPDLTRDADGGWIKSSHIIVKNLTLKQLKTYDVGRIKPNTRYAALFPSQKSVDHTSIPTLKEVIHYVNKMAGARVGFQIEIKTDPTQPNLSLPVKTIVSALEQVIREEGIVNRTKVQAYDWQCLVLLQKINPQIRTAYLTDVDQENRMHNPNPKIAGRWTAGALLNNYHNSIPEMIKSLGGRSWDVQDVAVTQAQITEAHRLGLEVSVWSWPERTGHDVDIQLIKKLIARQVDGVITDRPDVIRTLK